MEGLEDCVIIERNFTLVESVVSIIVGVSVAII